MIGPRGELAHLGHLGAPWGLALLLHMAWRNEIGAQADAVSWMVWIGWMAGLGGLQGSSITYFVRGRRRRYKMPVVMHHARCSVLQCQLISPLASTAQGEARRRHDPSTRPTDSKTPPNRRSTSREYSAAAVAASLCVALHRRGPLLVRRCRVTTAKPTALDGVSRRRYTSPATQSPRLATLGDPSNASRPALRAGFISPLPL